MPRRLKLCLLFACLSLTASADELAPLVVPRWQRDGSHLQLNCPVKPSAVYFRSGPERLVVEFAGVQMQGSPPGPLLPPGASEVRWRQCDMSHVVCEVGLAFRVPASQLKVSGTSIDLDLDYQWEDRYRLTPAVVWTRQEQAEMGRYTLWNELNIDPSDPKVNLEIGLAKDRIDSREKPTAMIERLDALAAVNGGYFADSGGPLGIVYKQGKLLAPHVDRRPPRTTLGVMKDGHIEFDQMVAQKGSLASRSGQTWGQVDLALGAGPRLLRRGQPALTTDEEQLGPAGNDITRPCARTAVATTRSGKILIVTVSGYRDNHLQGMRLEEVAQELLRRGGAEAMNLDGGASTSMSIEKKVVSYGPAAPHGEKAVATALLVKDLRVQSYPCKIDVINPAGGQQADGTSTVELEATVKDNFNRSVPDGTPVRFFAERLKLVSSTAKTSGGVAKVQAVCPTSCGLAKVWAESGAARDSCEFRLTSGPAARLWTVLRPALGVGNFSLTIQAVDRQQNPVKGLGLKLAEGDKIQLTGANGQTTFELSRPPGSKASTVVVNGDGGLNATVNLPAVDTPVLPGPGLTPSPSPSPSLSPSPSPSPNDVDDK